MVDIEMDDPCIDFSPIVTEELITAFGCTEPASIAYCGALMRGELGCEPEKVLIECSGNIIKNVKSVIIPNSGNLVGIEAAALLGILGGDPRKELEVLSSIRQEHIERTKKLLAAHVNEIIHLEGDEPLHIRITGIAGPHTAVAELKGTHTNCVYLACDDTVRIDRRHPEEEAENMLEGLYRRLSIARIIEYAQHVELEEGELTRLLEKQITCNTEIAKEGMSHLYGANIGQLIREDYGDSLRIKARAFTAAGSDARMNGCELPVVINSGSGNQGITVTVPVVQFALGLGVSRTTLYRALLISNLVAIHIKQHLRLSAFCGVVSAATASGAAITWLHGGTIEQISMTIINTLANISGIVCDGAKASCAAKIASSIDAAILAHSMSMHNRQFHDGEGLVDSDVERTISNIRKMANEGMHETDKTIIDLLINA